MNARTIIIGCYREALWTAVCLEYRVNCVGQGDQNIVKIHAVDLPAEGALL
jgi:hypothetical protein